MILNIVGNIAGHFDSSKGIDLEGYVLYLFTNKNTVPGNYSVHLIIANLAWGMCRYFIQHAKFAIIRCTL